MVLLHAVTSNLAVWIFCGLFEQLTSDYRVTAYDLRGHGHSGVTPNGYNSKDMAEDFRALHEALGLGPAVLVGHSFGAVVATHAALEDPTRVRGLVLADPFFPGLREVEADFDQANIWGDLREVFEVAGVRLGESVDLPALFRAVQDLTKEQFTRIEQTLGPSSARWLAQLPRLAETTCGTDVMEVAGLDEARLAKLAQPVTLLYDEHSPFWATCRHLCQLWPEARVETVPGAKHVAPLQNPTVFNALVRSAVLAMAPRPVRTA